MLGHIDGPFSYASRWSSGFEKSENADEALLAAKKEMADCVSEVIRWIDGMQVFFVVKMMK